PVTASPARIACWIGAAPRQRGSSDAWMFTHPARGQARSQSGSSRPYATTTSRSGGCSSPQAAGSDGSRSRSGCSTLSPCASAARFTGGGVSRRPRPAGRSGCVRTSGTSAPAATIASSVGTANSGVPANAMRRSCTAGLQGSERLRAGARGLRRLAPRLLQVALLDALALQRRQIVDEQLALEVIHLVLDALREQPVRLELERLAVLVERPDLDPLGPLDELVQPRDGQTPLLEALAAVRGEDFRVDEAARLIAPLGHVDHDDALVNVDLRRSKADAGRGIHRLEHVLDQALHVVVDNCDALGAYSQPRIGILENWESRHCGRPSVSCITQRNRS